MIRGNGFRRSEQNRVTVIVVIQAMVVYSRFPVFVLLLSSLPRGRESVNLSLRWRQSTERKAQSALEYSNQTQVLPVSQRREL